MANEPKRPAAWVPTLYFAEGVPFFAVSLIAGILYKRRGVTNDVIALYTSWLLLPWSLKPLWSPVLEIFKTKKFFVVLLQALGGLSLALVALCLPLAGYFRYTLALFVLVAFCSSTHDIAADGLYIASLSDKEQAAYAGWQGGFYNVARFFSQGGLIILAGYLERRMDVPHAWMAIFVAMGLILIGLSLYHARMLPTGGAARHAGNLEQMASTFGDVVVSFLKKPNIYLLLLFILLYRAGEGQVVRIGPLFLTLAVSLAASEIFGRVKASTASRFACMRMWEYRSSMARLRWPARASMVDSGTPASAILVSAVCRRS
jgi:PAT family beta-lactamase induction signal transducer AmpG